MSSFRFGIVSLLVLSFIILPHTGNGQRLTTKRLISLGDEHYKSQQYFKAAQFFKQALNEDKSNAEVLYKLADSYRNAYNYKQAEFYFDKYKATGDGEFPQAEFYLALSKKLNDKYEDAIIGFDNFIKLSKNFDDKALLVERAKVEKEGCKLALDRQKLPFIASNFELLGVPLSTKYNDYAPYLYSGDSSIIFTSSRKEAKGNLRDNRFGESFTDLFRYEFNGSAWKKIDNKDNFDVINTTFNEGAGSLSRDGTKNYFTRCEGPQCEIYVSKKVNDKWTKAVKLNENVNQSKFESKHPSISADGNTLFFVSNRSGGKGMNDIWMTVKTSDEDWEEARNLSAVNTTFNEGAPFYNDSLDILTFSSDGHPGYGGLDIFVLKGFNSGSRKVENMGRPYNTNFDDLYFTFGRSRGYLSSNRTNGKGGFDIYSFDIYSSFFDFEKLNEKSTSVSGIEEGDVSISGNITFAGNVQAGHKVYLVDENNRIIDSTYTDDRGKFEFSHLDENANYSFRLDENDANATISLSFMDSEGNVIKSVNSQTDPRSFQFESLEASSSALSARNSADDASISGNITFGGSAQAGETVYLIDEDGRVVGSTVTDTEGNFKFDHLDENGSYSFRLDEKDANSTISLSFMDGEGNVIKNVNSETDPNSFEFENLAALSSQMSTRNSADDASISGNITFGGSAQAGETVYLIDEDGRVVGSTVTDAEGNFKFDHLDENGSYSFRLDEKDANSTISLSFMDSEGNVIKNVNSETDPNSFEFENLAALSSQMSARNSVDDASISGNITFGGSAQVGETVYLVDENGRVVGSTVTDAEGKFKFDHLDENGSYSFRLDEKDANSTISLSFMDSEGNVIKNVNSETDPNSFEFENLAALSSQMSARNSADDASISGNISFGSSAQAGETVYLVDENGRVVDRTITDEAGNFKFDHLDENGSYSFRMDESNADASVSLSFVNGDGEVIEEMNSKTDTRSFQFQSLNESESRLIRQGSDDVSLSGSISFLGEQMGNKEVVLINEAGQEIGRTYTDENGKFNFSNLDENENYSFKLNETDSRANISLAFISDSGEVLKEIDSERDKRFFDFQSIDEKSSSVSTSFNADSGMSFELFKSKLTSEVDENEYKELEKSLSKEDKAKIVYRIQVGAFNNPPSDSYFENLNDMGKIEKRNEGGLVKFLIGAFRNLSIAEILRNEVYDRGIQDVFIGVYHQNKRIAILMYN